MDAMRPLYLLTLAFVLEGCGGTTTTSANPVFDAGADSPQATGADAATDDAANVPQAADSSADVRPPFDAGAFCSGSTARLMINGSDVSIINETGTAIILNCCNSAELTLATAAYQAPMHVLWREPAPTNGAIDLSNPPKDFAIEMDLGCDPSIVSCATASPEDRYVDGFSGTISYTTASALNVSYCLQVAESPSQPHTTIHSMAMYAPNVPSP
jgi:hypothetical protein